MAEEYLETKDPVQAPDDVVESKREALSILASLGSTKEFLGVEMSLGDIKKLSTKNVEKYYLRCQTILGKQLSSSLVDSAVLAASKAISMIVSIDDADQFYQDLKSDEIVKRELSSFAGLLILKGGRLVALASAFFQVAKHINIGKINRPKRVTKKRPVSLSIMPADSEHDVSRLKGMLSRLKSISEDSEQITKIQDAKPASKTKDPKKVAAGKKLAEYNKTEKEALAREIKREAESSAEAEAEDSGEISEWLPSLQLSIVLTVAGIGLTAADLFFRFYQSKSEPSLSDLAPVHTAVPATVELGPQQKSSAPPKSSRIGMA